MTDNDIFAIADEHYPDGLIRHYAHNKNPGGDSLAQYVVNDLRGICDGYPTDEEQLDAAIMRMEIAAREILAVADGFHEALRQLDEQKKPQPVS